SAPQERRRIRGFRDAPGWAVTAVNEFRVRCFQPLSHLSVAAMTYVSFSALAKSFRRGGAVPSELVLHAIHHESTWQRWRAAAARRFGRSTSRAGRPTRS